jgi:hypothetical protein
LGIARTATDDDAQRFALIKRLLSQELGMPKGCYRHCQKNDHASPRRKLSIFLLAKKRAKRHGSIPKTQAIINFAGNSFANDSGRWSDDEGTGLPWQKGDGEGF